MIRLVFPLILLMWLWPTPLIAQEDGTALVNAAQRSDYDEVVRLLAAGADPNSQDERGDTALRGAILFGHADIVGLLLAAGADPNLPNRVGSLPLHTAAYLGEFSIAQQLLAAGADPHMPNYEGLTAAEIARDDGNLDIAYLIEGKPVEPVLGISLVRAADRSDYDEVKRLLIQGVDPNSKDTYGYSALFYALPGLPKAAAIATARLLLEFGADPDLPVVFRGWTTLINMAWRGAAQEAALLLEYGADPNLGDDWGTTALFEAARNGYLETVNLLLAAGADVNRQDNFGYTALIHAITEEGHRGDLRLDFQLKRLDLAVLQRLVDAGADLNQRTHAGGNAFSYTTDIEVMNLLRNAAPNPIQLDGIGLTGLMLGVISGNEEIVNSSLAIDDPNAVDVTGINSALRYALRLDHPQIALRLLIGGANPNQANIHGETALYWAIQAGEDEFVDLLARLRQPPVAVNTLITSGYHGYLDTPLLLAARQGNARVVATLLRAGADPNLAGGLGKTLLIVAATIGNYEVVDLLLNAGADPNQRDIWDGAAHEHARWNDHPEVALRIEEAAASE